MSRFDYVQYDALAVDQQKHAKELATQMESLINTLGKGRAQSLALTKLEECYMWIGKQIRDDQISRGGSNADVAERSNG